MSLVQYINPARHIIKNSDALEARKETNMFSLNDFKKKNSSPSSIKAGVYHATVIEVYDNDKYVDGSAFIVRYKLCNADGSYVGEFQETFFNSTSNPRTLELADLMDKLGVETADDLVGKTFLVEIRFRITSYGKSLPSIVSRTPLSSFATPPSSSSMEES